MRLAWLLLPAGVVHREGHKQDVSELKSRLAQADNEIEEVETAYESLRYVFEGEKIQLDAHTAGRYAPKNVCTSIHWRNPPCAPALTVEGIST